jgi:deoxyribodipyrimidine photolyase-related protein
MKACLLYPHQLFEPTVLPFSDLYVLVEEPLYFTQYRFHKKKLIFHRSSMKAYELELQNAGKKVLYVESKHIQKTSDIKTILLTRNITEIVYFEFDDYLLTKRLKKALSSIPAEILSHPYFLLSTEEIQSYTTKKDFFFFHDFYIDQRKKHNILINQMKPEGGQWSFDKENRKKLPKNITVPTIPSYTASIDENTILTDFPDHYGSIEGFHFPTTRQEARHALKKFVAERFQEFGPYEDAIDTKESFLFHSILSIPLNVGLLSVQEVLNEVLSADVSLSSKEGFIRQLIGWREFIRLLYHRIGTQQRNSNILQHNYSLPASFYDGTTGILPVDTVIRRVLKEGYCHHIERLMVLGNFMLLCEIHPNHVYQWFMELFLDAYDWVMVANVYGMSQFADGGLMATKPYISGSSYILKMSNYPKGSWCEIWDALYWRFIDRHQERLKSNHRMSMMIAMHGKLKKSGVLEKHLTVANSFLQKLHQ